MSFKPGDIVKVTLPEDRNELPTWNSTMENLVKNAKVIKISSVANNTSCYKLIFDGILRSDYIWLNTWLKKSRVYDSGGNI